MSEETTLRKFLDFYESLKKETYKDLEADGLTHISHIPDDEFFSPGYFTDLLRSKQNVRELPYSNFQIYEELDGITQDLKYIIGILTLMHPHIANPPQEHGVYYMKAEDQIYLRYATFAFQSVYNFWDRLGDLLDMYFETKLKPFDVYFGRVLNRIDGAYKTTPQYSALWTFYDTKLKSLMDKRHEIVHQFQLKSKTRWEHVEHFSDLTRLKEDFKRTAGYFENFKEQLLNCFEGYRLTLNLISVLPDKPIPRPAT